MNTTDKVLDTAIHLPSMQLETVKTVIHERFESDSMARQVGPCSAGVREKMGGEQVSFELCSK